MTSIPILAHVENTGDVLSGEDGWAGRPGSAQRLEGFALTPPEHLIAREDVTYAAILDDGTLTPWLPPEAFCGTRGQARPLRGITVLLRGEAIWTWLCVCEASFTDGTRLSAAAGMACTAVSGAPLEALRVTLRPRPFAPSPTPAPAGAG